jgi:hypothetical protein
MGYVVMLSKYNQIHKLIIYIHLSMEIYSYNFILKYTVKYSDLFGFLSLIRIKYLKSKIFRTIYLN